MLENKLSRVGGWVAGLTENKTKPPSWGLAELGKILYALLHDSDYSEHGFVKVGIHMRMDSHPPTLLGQCPKFEWIFILTASLNEL